MSLLDQQKPILDFRQNRAPQDLSPNQVLITDANGNYSYGNNPNNPQSTDYWIPAIPFQTDLNGGFAPTAPNNIIAFQAELNRQKTFISIAAGVRTIFAGGNFSVGIYDINGNLLITSGVLSTNVVQRLKTVFPAITLNPGFYFAALTADNTTSKFPFGNSSAGVFNSGSIYGIPVEAFTAGNQSVGGALPNNLVLAGAIAIAAYPIMILSGT